jgi:hypothetical protein
MTPAERDLIADLFNRLKAADGGARDREAETLIADLVARQPAAVYLLTQTVLVQEQALKAATDRIAELEAAQAPVRDAPAPSFLGSAPRLGPWGSRQVEPTGRPAPYQPQQQQQPAYQAAPAMGSSFGGGGGGGFLRSALTTAAGVAGGALMFEGVRNLLSHGGGPFGSAAAAAQPAAGVAPPAHPHPASDSGDMAQNSSPRHDQDDSDQVYDDSDDDSGGDFADAGSDDEIV